MTLLDQLTTDRIWITIICVKVVDNGCRHYHGVNDGYQGMHNLVKGYANVGYSEG